ncbi:DUF1127 domain-containing protein [Roseibium alexandrii]|uniref:YjiS-like domain-containing protein n=1 Tax=Roseibium alexandrii TaxID=388408 RepID=A0A0M7AH23_9HYPH|nr:DUF1127 domain-containing protein [Roseibium alexandrii]CTQ73706.1 hypothetical protein LAX5112_03631 [Roseibium alexandrii]
MSLEIDTVFRRRAHNRSLFLTAIRTLAASVQLYLRRRSTERALARLSNQELDDIGLVRTNRGYRELHHDRLGASYWND